MLKTKEDVVNTCRQSFGRNMPRGVRRVVNRIGAEYLYFRAPKSRPDLKHFNGKRLSDDVVQAGQQAAQILGDFAVPPLAIEMMKKALVGAQSRAAIDLVPFSLTLEHINELYRLQQGRCAISNRWMELREPDGPKRAPWSPSLDREAPKLGYVPGNVRWVCLSVNVAMNKWGQEVFIELCKDVARRNP